MKPFAFSTADGFTFRKGTPAAKDAMKALWADCFPEDREGDFIPFYFARRYDADHTYLAYQGDTLCAMAHAPRLNYLLAGKSFTVPYIQGVATALPWRGRHLANRLLAWALRDARQEGLAFGLLKPFNVDFYAKSGWRVFSRLREIPATQLTPPVTSSANGRFLEWQTADPPLEELNRVFCRWLGGGFYSHPLRGAADWSRLLQDHRQDGGRLFLFFTGNKLQGYSLYREEAQQIILRETAATDPAVFWLLLQKTAAVSKREQQKPLLLHLPDRFPCFNKNDPGGRAEPFAMARVIHAPALLHALPLLAAEDTVSLTDEVLPENNLILRGDGKNKTASNSCRQITANQLTMLLTEWYNLDNEKTDEQPPRGCAYFNEYF